MVCERAKERHSNLACGYLLTWVFIAGGMCIQADVIGVEVNHDMSQGVLTTLSLTCTHASLLWFEDRLWGVRGVTLK